MLLKPQEIKLDSLKDSRGELCWSDKLPFKVQRFYSFTTNYSYDVRGGHAHKILFQIFFATNGSFNLNLKTPTHQYIFNIKHFESMVLVPPGYWRTISEMTPNSSGTVLASDEFDENDYLRNYNEYEIWFKDKYSDRQG